MLFRFITGLGLGGEWAVGHALIAESVPANTRARWSAFLQSGEPVGVGLAAIVGFMIAPIVGWRTVLMASSVTGLLALFFRKHLKESPIWLKKPNFQSTKIFSCNFKMHWHCSFCATIKHSYKNNNTLMI